MPADFWTPINAIENIDNEELSSALSSGNQGDDEASISRTTTSHDGDYRFLPTLTQVPPGVAPITVNNMFDRMRANNELGQAILDRWTSSSTGPTVPQSDFYAAQNAARTVLPGFPQHVDDVFSSVHFDHLGLLPTARADRSPSHAASDFFSGFEAQFREQDALDVQQQAEEPVPSFSLDLDPGTIADWDYLADMPELSFDRSVSLSTATSLPLITPSQSLDVLPPAGLTNTGEEIDVDLVIDELLQEMASNQTCIFDVAKDNKDDRWEAFLSLFSPGPSVNPFPSPARSPQKAFDVALGTGNCLGVTLQDEQQDTNLPHQDFPGTGAETQLVTISRYDQVETS